MQGGAESPVAAQRGLGCLFLPVSFGPSEVLPLSFLVFLAAWWHLSARAIAGLSHRHCRAALAGSWKVLIVASAG